MVQIRRLLEDGREVRGADTTACSSSSASARTPARRRRGLRPRPCFRRSVARRGSFGRFARRLLFISVYLTTHEGPLGYLAFLLLHRGQFCSL